MRAYSRRDFMMGALKGGALAATAGLLPGALRAFGEGEGDAGNRPNVLFIAIDDLRPQINCYGHKMMISPNIDRLAGSGVKFSRTYCQYPVCGASRASLLSGARPTADRFKSYKTRADADMPSAISLPQWFKDHGYHTISNGKIFHHADDHAAKAWSEKPWFTQGDWAGPGYVTEENKRICKETGRYVAKPYEAGDYPDNANKDGKLAEKTIADLRRMKEAGKPFFLATGFWKPHLPFTAPQKYWDLYDHDAIDLADNPFRPKGCPDRAMHNWGELRNYYCVPKEGPVSEEMNRTLVHGYYACVSYVDAQIGLVLDELDRLGLADNTVVVLWGDHGWNLGEHGLWAKHCNFDTSLHSPMIVRAPGSKAGVDCAALTEFVDIYPTLCDLCGLPAPDHLEGSSFAPLLRDPQQVWKPAVFSKWGKGYSMRTDRYLYTEWVTDEGVETRMLYDHRVDPAENVNIAEDPANVELVKKLHEMVQAGYKHARPGMPAPAGV